MYYHSAEWRDFGFWTASGTDIFYEEGKVGIGITNPTSLLNVLADFISPFRVDDFSGSGDSDPFIIDGSGNVGIGLVTLQTKVHISDNNNAIASTVDVSDYQLFLNISSSLPAGLGNGIGFGNHVPINVGAAIIYQDKGEAQFTTSSSRALKENFVTVQGDGMLKKMKEIPVYIYDFKEGPNNKMGLVAEDF